MKSELSLTTLMIALGVCVTLLAGCAGLVVLAHYRESEPASAESADAEFARLRSRFAGQRPLLDMNARHVVERPDVARAVRTTASIHSFHTVIFDTRGSSRLVRMSAPFAIARMFAHRDGRFRWLGELTFLDDTEFDPEPMQLSFEEIREHGPGLIVDYRHATGGQFIAWVE